MFNDHKRILPAAFDDEYERHIMWAHLCSGGAGSGLRWPARHPHVLTSGMKTALKSLGEFARLVEWNTFFPSDWRAKIRAEGISHRALHLFAVGDSQQIIGSLIRRPPGGRKGRLPRMETLRGIDLCVGNLQKGVYEVTTFDPVQGRILTKDSVSCMRGRIKFPLASWEHEIAFALRRIF